jgi:hypothetical protein
MQDLWLKNEVEDLKIIQIRFLHTKASDQTNSKEKRERLRH